MKQIFLIVIFPVLILLGSCGGNSDSSPQSSNSTRTDGLGQAINYPNPSNYLYVGDTAIGDLNGDGLNDVVAIQGSNNTGLVLIYYQNILGSLDGPVSMQTDVLTKGVAIADVNSDGKIDLIICGLSKSAGVGYLGRVVIYLQDSISGELQSPQSYEVSSNGYVRNLVVVDLNGDGRNDTAVFSPQVGADPYLSLFYQNTQGALSSEVVIGKGIVGHGSAFQIADMNNDGRNDIVITNGLNGMAVLNQLASGKFSTTPQLYSDPVGSIVLGDMNGDGRNDVLATGPGNTSIKLFLQNSDGTLNSPVILDVQIINPAYGMKIADITCDGLNDIVLDVNDPSSDGSGWGGVAVFPQRADHTFAQRVYYSYHSPTFGGSFYDNGLSIGDVTGDGRLDVVVPWADEGLHVFPGITL